MSLLSCADTYGSGSSLPILLDDLACVGSETTLANCRSRGIGLSE